MRFSTLLAPLGLIASALAAPYVLVHNNCDFAVYVTSVGLTPGNTTVVQPDNYWTEEQYFQGIGTAIKITQSPAGLWTAKPTLHFSYTYNEGQNIYYDLSTVYGFDFWGQKITVVGDEGKDVPALEWDGAPLPNHTVAFFGETDLTVELCAA